MFAIARGIGVPLSLDDATINRTLGHIARVLVDLDMASDLRNQILVEREGFAFFVEIDYERLPAFCSFCGIIGHSLVDCRKSGSKPDGDRAAKKSVVRYVPKKIVSKDLDDGADLS